MEWLLPALILGAAAVVAALVLRRVWAPRPPMPDAGLTLLQNQVHAAVQQTAQQMDALRLTVGESMQALSGQVTQALASAQTTMSARLDSTARVVADVRQQLGQLEASSRRITELGKDIAELEQILRPPKLRGSLGELFLAELLAQILPSEHYRLQHAFRGGEVVDAVIRLRAGLVPVDAKFPLENFKRIFSAASEEERKAAKRGFVKDVRGHIDDIAAKYIRMDEGTFDFALMYVPAENVYYETILKDDEFGGELALFSYALKKRVIPVSPNSFYAYLQTIILGLKGLRVEERSREILENLSRLQREFDSFAEAFRLVGQHLDNSMKKFSEAQRRFERIGAKVEQMDGLARGLEAGAEAGPERQLATGGERADPP
jgi:DNA recombination protein RmuC